MDKYQVWTLASGGWWKLIYLAVFRLIFLMRCRKNTKYRIKSLLFNAQFVLKAQSPLCDSGTNRFGSSCEQFDWLATRFHCCAQFCNEKKNHRSWFDLLQGFTDNRPHLATRIQTPSARDGNLDKCGNVIPFWRKFPVPAQIGSWP